MPLDSLLLFIAAGLLLNLTPGPDVLYIVTQSLRRGSRAGVFGALGVTAGCFVHVGAAAAGLGALLGASSTAFTLLKWLGATYLVWMGLRSLLAGPTTDDAQLLAPAPLPDARLDLRGAFFGGFLTNVLNPKVALFFLAFVPQFIPAEAPHKALVFVLLGVLFNLNSVAINVAYAVLASALARRSGALQRARRWLQRAAGLMFIGFGLRLAMSDNPVH